MNQNQSATPRRRGAICAVIAIMLVAGAYCTKEKKSDVGESCARTADCADGLKCVRAENMFRQPVGSPTCQPGGTTTGGCCSGDRKSGHREACLKSDDCEGKAECSDNTCIDPEKLKAEKREIFERLQCNRKMSSCRSEGLCTVKEEPSARLGFICVAASDEDCKQSLICKRYGKCTAKNGECVAK